MYTTYEDIIEDLKKKNFQKRIDKLAKKYKDKEVYIYGAGMTFEAINNNYDLSGLNIKGVADIKFTDEDSEYSGYKAFTPKKLAESSPEIVLIAMHEEYIAETYFEKTLFPNYGDFEFEPFIKHSFFELLKELFSG